MSVANSTGTDTPLFSKEDWGKHAERVTNEMKVFTQKFATPISRIVDDNFGIPWGTGSYIELSGRPQILTNEHVAQALNAHSLGQQFLGDDTYRATSPFHAEQWPLDVAVSAIEEKVWTCKPHCSEPIPGSGCFTSWYDRMSACRYRIGSPRTGRPVAN